MTDSLLVALDTATPRSVVCIGRPGDTEPLAFDEELAKGKQASETLAPRLRRIADEAGVSMRDVTHVAVGRGPGTFTGARVAVATAKGIALGLGIPLHPFSTLECIAYDVDGSGPVLATLDARKGEVYAGLWTTDAAGNVARRGEETVEALPTVWQRALEFVHGPPTLAGTGIRADESLVGSLPSECLHPTDGVTGRGVWRAANVAITRPGVAAVMLDVTYLRKSYAELGIHVPKRPFQRSPFV